MTFCSSTRGTFLVALMMVTAAVIATGPAAAQDFGDTPYVQTPQNVVDRMLDLARVGAADYVIDLGSGDGRMVITAAKKYGARGFGVDLDRRLVTLSNRLAAKAGVADRAKFYERDLYETDLSPATVLTIYLLPEVNLMVRPRLFAQLAPGTRVVSHDYDFGDWPPDQTFTMDAPGKPVGRDQKSKVFYWIVPGKAAGRWAWRETVDGKPRDFQLALRQNFQKISGTLSVDGQNTPITDALLAGENISFGATVQQGGAPVSYRYSGHIVNNAIEGEARAARGGNEAKAPWNASRVELWEPEHLVQRTADAARP
jgi:SAM-dependent methyltransferase